MNRGQRRARWLGQHRNAIRAQSEAPDSVFDPRAGSASGHLHIEELVLHGFPASSGRAIGDATQQELLRMLRVRGLPAQMTRDATHVGASSFQLPSGAQPKAVGALLAKAVYGGAQR